MPWLFSGLIDYFPESVFTDINEDGTADDDSIVLPEAHAYDLCENLPELILRTMRTLFDDDITDAYLFETIRETFNENLFRASGLSIERQYDRDPKRGRPIQSIRLKQKSPRIIRGLLFFDDQLTTIFVPS